MYKINVSGLEFLTSQAPKRAINDRFEVIFFSTEEWEKFQNILGFSVPDHIYREEFRKIINRLEELGADRDLNSIADWLEFGIYMHVHEDGPIFIDEIAEYPYCLCVDEYGNGDGGLNNIDSDAFAIYEDDRFVFADSWEEIGAQRGNF